MRNSLSIKILISLFSLLLIGGLFNQANGQDVIRASGGTGLSIDNVGGAFTEISGPTIRETATGQLQQNGTVVLTLPPGYEWNTSLTIGEENILVEGVGANNTKLGLSFTSISANEITFSVNTESTSNGNGQGPGRVTFSGLELRPANTTIPDEGIITNTGTTGPTNLNYGDLSKIAGSIAEVRIESESDGSGDIISAQDILAGNSLIVYAIGRDFAGNFVSNISLENEDDWVLTDITGGLNQGNLTPANNLQSATFSSQVTGSAKIQGVYQDATPIPTGTINVLPRQTQQIFIESQPSESAVAGETFPQQPVIHLLDTFGNLVTTDNETEVNASIETGDGNLGGTTTVIASDGVIQFSDLFAELAETITLSFSSGSLAGVTSNEVIIQPATASSVDFTFVPEAGNQGLDLTPPVRVQLFDAFNNLVEESAISVDLSINSGDGQLQGVTSVQTDNTGEAIFDQLSFSTEGIKTILAESDGLSSAVSNEIEIFSEAEVSGFIIEAAGGGEISNQTAGDPFEVDIYAVNSSGTTITDFTGTVELTSSSEFISGGGTTPAFTDGTLTGYEIALSTSGQHTLTATDSGNASITSDSEPFTILQGVVNFNNTEMTASPAQITADGESTSLITVQLRDSYENNLTTGGESVEIETDRGFLSTSTASGETSVFANDNGDGTYTATLTSTTEVETATLNSLNNGTQIASTTVDFTFGEIASFIITVPETDGEPDDQIAGQTFPISIEAVDEDLNRIEDYSGTVTLSTNSEFSAGETVSISNGFVDNHSVTLTRSGDGTTISAEDSNLFGVTGSSREFTVVADSPVASESQVTVTPKVIESSAGAESIITIILRDQYSNRVLRDESSNIAITLNRLDPATGSPAASLSAVTYSSQTNQHQATLTATVTQELLEITASLSGIDLPQNPTVDIVNPIIWSPGGGPESVQNDWTNPENWTPQRQPEPGDFVVIPGGENIYPDLDLNINVGSMDIQNGAQLVLFGGNAINITGDLNIDGTLDIEDNTALRVEGNLSGSGSFASGLSTEIQLGGDLSLSSFLAGTEGTVVQFNGQTLQTLTTQNLLAQRLEILNDVTVSEGDIINTSELLITEGNSFILAQDADITLDNLQSISGEGELQLNNNTLVIRGDLDLLSIDASEGTVIFGIRISENFADYPNLSRQRINNLTQMKNAVINNTEGVRTFDDIIVDGDLTLQNGDLIISSGQNFIAPNTNYVNGRLQFRRTLSNRGWKMLSAPVASTFQDFFDGLTVQGFSGSTYENRQPNLMWYDETFVDPTNPELTTDNQRWTAPNSISDSPETGLGYFFYVFGDVPGDNDYNDPLPSTITISGQENFHGEAGEFTFPVTYTAEADTGWNMVGNPFGATLDWDKEDWAKENIDNVLYIWDLNAQEYKYWNGEAGSHGGGRIAPFQGFWVKANSEDPVLAVNPSNKTTGGVYRKQVQRYENVPVIALQLESEFHTTSTHFTFTELGSFTTDRQDAYRLLPFDATTYLELYSLFSDGTELAINNLPRDFGKTIEIPIEAGAVVDGNFYDGIVSMTWPELKNIPESWSVVIKDNHTGERINLKENSFYDFETRNRGKTAPVVNTQSNFTLIQKSAAKSRNARFTLFIEPGDDGSELPEEVALNQNYPNPFNPSTSIEFALPVEDRVRIDVFDVLGRKIQTLVDQRYQAGYHEIDFDGNSLASGVYFYRLITSDKVLNKRMTLIK